MKRDLVGFMYLLGCKPKLICTHSTNLVRMMSELGNKDATRVLLAAGKMTLPCTNQGAWEISAPPLPARAGFSSAVFSSPRSLFDAGLD